MADRGTIPDEALDSLSVTPGDAGDDAEIRRRVKADPENKDAQLDEALDESMDASDPTATTQPGRDGAAPSSGYDEEAERQRDA